MEQTFKPSDYLQHLAHQLVANFNYAGKATTPGLVGGARETEVKNKLSILFPGWIGVGTGCIIDSYGGTSKQTDVVLYEKDICPVFSINNTPESTYYPCESVMAVGEIKSTLDRRDLTDSFAKIKSIKSLNRHYVSNEVFRSYNSLLPVIGDNSQRFDASKNELDQIYGFILCERIALRHDSFMELMKELINKDSSHVIPNLIISLRDGIFFHSKSENGNIVAQYSAHNANSIFSSNLNGGEFGFLLKMLNILFTRGRTTSRIPFDLYIDDKKPFPAGSGLML